MTAFIALATLLVVGSLAWLLRPSTAAGPHSQQRPTDVGLIVVMPMTIFALYAALGRPDAIAPPPADPDRALAEERTARLAARLDTSPDDVAGWRLLARSHEQLRHMPEAIRAYRRLVAMQPDDAAPLVDLAFAVSATLGGSYSGEPITLARKALALDSRDTRALAIVANEAAQRDDLEAAIAAWERIDALVPADSDVARSLRLNIEAAQQMLAAQRTDVQQSRLP